MADSGYLARLLGIPALDARVAANEYDTCLLAGVRVQGAGAGDGYFARDYEWSRDPGRDPRLRRLSTRAYFLGAATGTAYVPSFAHGWAW